MIAKHMPKLYEQLGTIKFTILYGVMFSVTLNIVLFAMDVFMFGDQLSIRKVTMYLLAYFLLVFFLSRHIIKRIKSGEL